MLIENHTYKLHWSGAYIIRDEGTSHEMRVPVVEDNWAYQEFLRWDAIDGNDPVPADPEPPAPLDLSDKAALDALRLNWLIGQARLQGQGAGSIQSQMDAIQTDTINTQAKSATHIKTLSEAVEELSRQVFVLKRAFAAQAGVPDR